MKEDNEINMNTIEKREKSTRKIIAIIISSLLLMIIVALSQIIPMIQYDIKYKEAESKKINYYVEENSEIHFKDRFNIRKKVLIISSYVAYDLELKYHPEIKKELDKNIDENYFKQGNSILVVEDCANSKDGIEGLIYDVKLNDKDAKVMICRKNREKTDSYQQYSRLYFIPINENNIQNLTYKCETPPHFSIWGIILEISIFILTIVFLIIETKIKKENRSWFIKKYNCWNWNDMYIFTFIWISLCRYHIYYNDNCINNWYKSKKRKYK